ncbi:LuxR C-terminal-related transcriptional regulator [Roseovarius autotrophicus]|uniref:LuxR C-terminal-related transcriptional regulator n=1 Tax=Roseovarius autotrophicus TaxID=2824121 RepID=UPI0019F08AC9|nr:response regulator transcription factor [Roseovarius autotrophicus]MBE0452368.1 response regulator transcription factor [Roseovarius sp.]
MVTRDEIRSGFATGSVLIVDDHPLYSDALAAAICLVYPSCTVVQTSSLRETLAQLDAGLVPDLVMFDLRLPDVAGISGFVSLRERLGGVPVLVISALASAELVRALMREGAAGYLPKEASAQELRRAIAQVGAGRCYVPQAMVEALHARPDETTEADRALANLTPQQQKIMRLICAGKANKQIAYELSLAEATVKAHITALLNRLGVKNRTQAAVLVNNARAQGSGDPETRAYLNG